ncbi:RNA methyltransferase [Hydrogenoanaerobacterium sp.]|uniref:TrmH family RNA methyltransferase n=1 Tax=Hydrogenoanaerobacterium sp. TaxID=2953763 RepID=UPI00289A502C|nr:RNA methyltransferase [Hydrogenoanaerobacterium sp.]
MDRITSRENQNIKQVIRLMKSKKERTQSGFFVAEGIKLCMEAVAGGIVIDELYCTAGALEKYSQRLALLCQNAKICYEITADIADKLADTSTPQGVYAVCRLPENTLTEGNLTTGRYLALESLQDPGNIGTILRTADAFGIDGVILTADCPDIFSPKVLRSTMGSVFRVPVCITTNLAGLLENLNKTHSTYAATLSERAVSIRTCNLTQAAVAVIGNEGNGLSQDVIDRCTHNMIIDMHGGAESLNAAVAAAVVMWEMSGKARL